MSNFNERQQPAWSGSYYDDDALFDFYCESTKADALFPSTSASPSDTPGIARNKSEIKPLFQRGDRVYANWIHDYDGKYWYRGAIEDFRELEKPHPVYGPVRIYSIIFDDGTSDTNITDDKVMREDDYAYFTDEKLRNQWIAKGVKNRYDLKSDDTYARSRGWFETTRTGTKMFTSLTDAIKANDLIIRNEEE